MKKMITLFFLLSLGVWALTPQELGKVIVDVSMDDTNSYQISYQDGSVKNVDPKEYRTMEASSIASLEAFYKSPNRETLNGLSVTEKYNLADFAVRGNITGPDAPYNHLTSSQKEMVLRSAKNIYDSLPNKEKVDRQTHTAQMMEVECQMLANKIEEAAAAQECYGKLKDKINMILNNIAGLQPNAVQESICQLSTIFSPQEQMLDKEVHNTDDKAIFARITTYEEKFLLSLNETSSVYRNNKNLVCKDSDGSQFSLTDKLMEAEKKYGTKNVVPIKNAGKPAVANFKLCQPVESAKRVKENYDTLKSAPNGTHAFSIQNQKPCFLSFDMKKNKSDDFEIQFRDSFYRPDSEPINFTNFKDFIIKTYGEKALDQPEIKSLMNPNSNLQEKQNSQK
jgi:hypothetical protein